MSGLEIKPHSQRISGLAVVGLALVAVSAFSAGLNHQRAATLGPSPFPAPILAQSRAPDTIPEATPAREVQLADYVRRPRPVKAPPSSETPPDESAATPPALDASAMAPEPPASAPQDAPADPNI